MKTTFIYVLKDPRTGEIRYVGKSDNPQKRLSSHLGEARDNKCHRKAWIKSLKLLGLRPALEVIDEVLESEWQALECAYIEFFIAEGYALTNNTLGGDGVANPAPATRARQSAARLGKPLPQATRTNMSAAHQKRALSGLKRADNTSGFLGVCWNRIKKRWIARILVAGHQRSLGYFSKVEDAVFARALAVDKYFPKST